MEGKEMSVREHLDGITKTMIVANQALEKALAALRGDRPVSGGCDRNAEEAKRQPGIMDMVNDVGALSEMLRANAELLAVML